MRSEHFHIRKHGRHGSMHIDSERRRSTILLTFGAVRICAWTVMAACVGLGLLHVDGFSWADTLAVSVPFVVLISIYANWATDLDAATAAYAALVSSNAHHAAAQSGQMLSTNLPQIEEDIARLAKLEPCPEADELAHDIFARLNGQ